jgi:cell division GTPase FtsZ
VIRGAATDETNIIFGATVDDRLTGQVWVTVVATGIGRGVRARRPLFSTPALTSSPSSGRQIDEDDMDVPSFLRR